VKRRRPVWLHTTLLLLLCTMGLGLWLSAAGKKEIPVSVDRPAVLVTQRAAVFEDYRHAPALRDIGGKARPDVALHGIALILDDAGYDLSRVRRVLALPFPVAISVLPDAPHAREVAEMAHRQGHTVMLHVPMQFIGQPDGVDDGFLRTTMGRAEIKRRIEQALTRVPYVAGINNHMGSLLTSMAAPMRWVMEVCRRRGLFFVDSRTSKETVAAVQARQAGLRWAERRVFLDHDPARLDASWQLALRYLARDGYCVVIMHPHEATLAFLEHRLPVADRRHIVPLRNVLHPA